MRTELTLDGDTYRIGDTLYRRDNGAAPNAGEATYKLLAIEPIPDDDGNLPPDDPEYGHGAFWFYVRGADDDFSPTINRGLAGSIAAQHVPEDEL